MLCLASWVIVCRCGSCQLLLMWACGGVECCKIIRFVVINVWVVLDLRVKCDWCVLNGGVCVWGVGYCFMMRTFGCGGCRRVLIGAGSRGFSGRRWWGVTKYLVFSCRLSSKMGLIHVLICWVVGDAWHVWSSRCRGVIDFSIVLVFDSIVIDRMSRMIWRFDNLFSF